MKRPRHRSTSSGTRSDAVEPARPELGVSETAASLSASHRVLQRDSAKKAPREGALIVVNMAAPTKRRRIASPPVTAAVRQRRVPPSLSRRVRSSERVDVVRTRDMDEARDGDSAPPLDLSPIPAVDDGQFRRTDLIRSTIELSTDGERTTGSAARVLTWSALKTRLFSPVSGTKAGRERMQPGAGTDADEARSDVGALPSRTSRMDHLGHPTPASRSAGAPADCSLTRAFSHLRSDDSQTPPHTQRRMHLGGVSEVSTGGGSRFHKEALATVAPTIDFSHAISTPPRSVGSHLPRAAEGTDAPGREGRASLQFPHRTKAWGPVPEEIHLEPDHWSSRPSGAQRNSSLVSSESSMVEARPHVDGGSGGGSCSIRSSQASSEGSISSRRSEAIRHALMAVASSTQVGRAMREQVLPSISTDHVADRGSVITVRLSSSGGGSSSALVGGSELRAGTPLHVLDATLLPPPDPAPLVKDAERSTTHSAAGVDDRGSENHATSEWNAAAHRSTMAGYSPGVVGAVNNVTRVIRVAVIAAVALLLALCWIGLALPLVTHLSSPEDQFARHYVPSYGELHAIYRAPYLSLTPSQAEQLYWRALSESLERLERDIEAARYRVRRRDVMTGEMNNSVGLAPGSTVEQILLLRATIRAYVIMRHRVRLYARSRMSSRWRQHLLHPLHDVLEYAVESPSLGTVLRRWLWNPSLVDVGLSLFDAAVCLRQDEKLPCPTMRFWEAKAAQHARESTALNDSNGAAAASAGPWNNFAVPVQRLHLWSGDVDEVAQLLAFVKAHFTEHARDYNRRA